MPIKVCNICNLPKDLETEFYINRNRTNKGDGEPWRFAHCKTCHNTLAKKQRKKRYAEGLCSLCDKSRAWGQQKCDEHVKQQKTDDKRRNDALRLEALDHYGSRECACCQENHIEFLSLDHINGGGNKHRQQIKRNFLPRWLKQHNWPEGFRVLCHNCNQALGHYGYCPHEKAHQSA